MAGIQRTLPKEKKEVVSKKSFKDKYKIGSQVLGKGSYAEVKLAIIKKTGEQVAVKTINKRKMKRRDVSKVQKEVKILQSLSHPNIVKVYDAFVDSDYFYIVMEYASGGDLFSKIVKSNKDFTEIEAKEIIEKLASALKYCKDNGVIHRDIKPENILITEDGDIKLADFNLSKKISREDIYFSILETECGTPNYVAPEVLSHRPYDYKCDVWSVGVILFILLSGGFLPFFPDDENAPNAKDVLLYKVKEGEWSFVPRVAWKSVSEEGKDLVSKMLVKDPDNRITYEDILDHKWLCPPESPKADKSRVIDISYLSSLKTKIDDLKAKHMVRVATYIYKAVEKFEELMYQKVEVTETTEFFNMDI